MDFLSVKKQALESTGLRRSDPRLKQARNAKQEKKTTNTISYMRLYTVVIPAN